MRRYLMSRTDVVSIRDDRYATLWELGGPATGLKGLSAAFVAVDPGRESPPHYHLITEEMYLIVRGQGEMHIAGECYALSAGDSVSIPVGVIHAIKNTGTDPIEMWVVTTPPYTDDDDFEVTPSEVASELID